MSFKHNFNFLKFLCVSYFKVPTNVGAEYLAAEEKYLKAKDKKEKIKWLKEMIKHAPKHKGTEKLLAQLKKTLNKLEEEIEKEKLKKSSRKSLFSVEKEGEALVSLIGLPNSGKSLILSKLTNSKPLVTDYPFSTTKPEIGMLNCEGSLIQLVDLPPFTENVVEDRRELFGVVNNSDLLVIVIDLSEDVEYQFNTIMNEFKKAKILIGREKPFIEIKKTERGGIEIVGLKEEEIKEAKKILLEHKYNNAIVNVKKGNLDDLRLVLENFKFINAIVVGNKGDLPNTFNNFEKLKNLVRDFNEKENVKLDVIAISALKEKNLNVLKNKIWDNLHLIRVFTKDPKKKKVDYPPVTLKEGSSVRDLVEKIHKEFLKKFRFAKVYGKSAKFDGQTVGLEHILEDKDIVEIYLK